MQFYKKLNTDLPFLDLYSEELKAGLKQLFAQLHSWLHYS